MTLSRRQFVQAATAIGAALAWSGRAAASTSGWRESRDLYPEGVASGDPEPDSIILWTRRPPPMWEARFGPGRAKRALAAFGGGVVAMFGARLADG